MSCWYPEGLIESMACSIHESGFEIILLLMGIAAVLTIIVLCLKWLWFSCFPRKTESKAEGEWF
jgi:hypothetical protein